MCLLAVLALCSFLIAPRGPVAAQPGGNLDWAYYGNDVGNMRFVDVDQISPGNAGVLSLPADYTVFSDTSD